MVKVQTTVTLGRVVTGKDKRGLLGAVLFLGLGAGSQYFLLCENIQAILTIRARCAYILKFTEKYT